MSVRLNIIVAVCEGEGIGQGGQLPWRLREEMKYFTRMTKKTNAPEKQNVVVMGRKTWESIPKKFRPLPGRINVVLTSQAKSNLGHFDGSTVCSSFEDALREVHSLQAETVWAIGGFSVYKMALECEQLHRIYLTRILKDFECDTFFPSFDSSKFRLVGDSEVPSEIQQEGDIRYKYEVLEKL
nr:dihydrofolate reductase-like [Cherax quadricarinatus]